jgi:hypothetical protein
MVVIVFTDLDQHFRTVSWSADMNRWAASITVNGVSRNLGYYHELDKAAEAYRVAAIEAWGDFAYVQKAA